MMTQQNYRPLVRVFHQGCVSNLPDENKRPKVKKNKNSTKCSVNIATWNVRSLKDDSKLENLLSEMKRLNIDLLGVAETHWISEVTEAFEQENHVIIHSCRRDNLHRQGVAIILSQNLAENLIDYKLISERIISVTLDMVEGPLTIFQIYAPDTSYSDVEIELFYELLQDEINQLPRRTQYLLLGDFNAKVGSNAYLNWPEVAGRFSLGKGNESGEKLLMFCGINNLSIMNTVYKHKEHKLVTWTSPDGCSRNQIDFIIAQQKWKAKIKNCRVYNSADMGSDHSLLMSTCIFKSQKKKKAKKAKALPRKYDVSKLSDKTLKETFEIKIGGAFEPLMNLETSIDDLYDSFKKATNAVTMEVVGRKRRKQVDGMSVDVATLCEKRRNARLKSIGAPASKKLQEEYRSLNTQVKKAVADQKKANLERKIENLEEDFKSNNSKNLFKTVRELEGKPKRSLLTVKDKQGNKHSQLDEVLACWEEHFQTHLNTSFPHQPDAVNQIHVPLDSESSEPEISKEEIRQAVKSMKRGKSPGIDEITAEVIKAGGEAMIDMLEKISKKVWNEEKSPKDWSRMLVNPIYKKGDKIDPANYRAIALLSIPGKVFLRVLLQRMRKHIEVSTKESQYGFRPGRGTVDAIFIVKQIMQKAKERKVAVHFNFIDFKAAFDTVWRKALWKMLRAIGVDGKIVNIIENLYEATECAVVINGHITEWFEVNVGVRQGCLLSPTLFNLFLEYVMEELETLQSTLEFNSELSIDIRYADDTTLIAAIFDKLKLSTSELETSCKKWGMKVNPDKCKIISSSEDNICIDNQMVEKTDEFVFLGSVVPGSSSDVNRKIGMATSAFGRLKEQVWSRKDISMPLKLRLYYALIVPIVVYASETWTLLEEDERKLNVFEMKCLRSILGVTLCDRMRNVDVRGKLKIKRSIVDIVRKRRLTWFGHVVRLPDSSFVKKAYKEDFAGKRPRGRPPKRWTDQIKKDTGIPLLTAERIAQDRDKWRGCVLKHVAKLSGVCTN